MLGAAPLRAQNTPRSPAARALGSRVRVGVSNAERALDALARARVERSRRRRRRVSSPRARRRVLAVGSSTPAPSRGRSGPFDRAVPGAPRGSRALAVAIAMARSRRALEAVASRARRDALSRDVAGSPPGVRSSRHAALAPMRLLALLAVVFHAGSLPRVVLGRTDEADADADAAAQLQRQEGDRRGSSATCPDDDGEWYR